MHRADEGKHIGALGHVGHQLTDMRARDIGGDGPQLAANSRGGLGLEIKHVDVARPAEHPQEDAVHLALWLGRLL